MPQISQKNPFNSLPTELAQILLCSVSDGASLKALALSCSHLYRSFYGAKKLILEHVLGNEFHPDVLSDALTMCASARVMEKYLRDRDSVQELEWVSYKKRVVRKNSPEHQALQFKGIMDRYRRPTPISMKYWSLARLAELSRKVRHVKYFTQEFVRTLESQTLRPDGLPLEEPISLTNSEINRIERAFYRYEVFCNICHLHCGTEDPTEQKEMFFGRFAPWETEQLVSVYEFLQERLGDGKYWPQIVTNQLLNIIAFRDVARHDVEWGSRCIFYLSGEIPDQLSGYLACGLAYLHQLAIAASWGERHHLLNEVASLRFYKPLENLVLRPDTGFIFGPDPQWSVLPEYEKFQRFFTRACFPEADLGPYSAWTWASMTEKVSLSYGWTSHRTLRLRGYVMFNYIRLLDWNILDSPFEPPSVNPSAHVRGDSEEFEAMKRSWAARHEVWLCGGRGWWGPGDESRIIWGSSNSSSFSAESLPTTRRPENTNSPLNFW